MAVAFRVSDAKDLAAAFAAHDEFLSRVAENIGVEKMAVDDDFYTAPYCFMRTTNSGGGCGYIIFSAYMCRYPHDLAADAMTSGNRPLIFGSIALAQVALGVRKEDVFKFRDSAWMEDGRDISQALEDTAVEVTCEKMGWKVPVNWRQCRRVESSIRCNDPIQDLAERDRTDATNPTERRNVEVPQ